MIAVQRPWRTKAEEGEARSDAVETAAREAGAGAEKGCGAAFAPRGERADRFVSGLQRCLGRYSPLEGRKAFLRNQKPSMRPPGSPLLNAVLGTLSDDGPCPTAFSASPAAEFECDGLRRLASEGWWVCYACKLEIFSSAPDDPDEIVELTFTPPDKKVHNGKPFSWMLSMAIDDSGVRRLVLHDKGEYAMPLLNVLSYHAIAQCRERLLQMTALRLGQTIVLKKSAIGAVVTGVLAAVGLYKDVSSSDVLATTTSGNFGGGGGDVAAAAARLQANPTRPPHVNLPPLQPAAAFKVLDETPRNTTSTSQQPSVLSNIFQKISSARSNLPSAPVSRRSEKAAAAAAVAKANAAELFFINSSAAAAEAEGGSPTRSSPGGGLLDEEEVQVVYSTAMEEAEDSGGGFDSNALINPDARPSAPQLEPMEAWPSRSASGLGVVRRPTLRSKSTRCARGIPIGRQNRCANSCAGGIIELEKNDLCGRSPIHLARTLAAWVSARAHSTLYRRRRLQRTPKFI